MSTLGINTLHPHLLSCTFWKSRLGQVFYNFYVAIPKEDLIEPWWPSRGRGFEPRPSFFQALENAIHSWKIYIKKKKIFGGARVTLMGSELLPRRITNLVFREQPKSMSHEVDVHAFVDENTEKVYFNAWAAVTCTCACTSLRKKAYSD